MKVKIKAIYHVFKVAFITARKILSNKQVKEKDPVNYSMYALTYQTRKYLKEYTK